MSRVTRWGEGVNQRKLSSVTQSRTAKIGSDASPKYTENKRTTVKNSVTRRHSRKSERDEGVNPSRKKNRVARDGVYKRPLTLTIAQLARQA